MKQSTFQWLVRELASAVDRTGLTVATRGVVVWLHGRGSPYRSHQEVEFAPDNDGEPLPGADAVEVILRDAGRLVVVPFLNWNGEPSAEPWRRRDEPTEVFEADVVRVPRTLLQPLEEKLQAETGGFVRFPLPQEPLVWVALYRRRVVGYEDGRPVLASWDTVNWDEVGAVPAEEATVPVEG